MRFLIPLTIGAMLLGCSHQPAKPDVQASETPPGTRLAVLEVNGDEVREFFDRWNAFQVQVLRRNVMSLERSYLELKKNPPVDPRTNQPLDVKPSMGLGMGARMMGMRSVSPAVNTFSLHMDSAGDGLIGYIPEPAARLRVWVADRGVTAGWYLYSLAALEKERPYPTFRDTIGTRGTSVEAEQQLLLAAKDALAGKFNPLDFGRNGTYIETKRLDYDNPSCITCHPNKKLGDLAGIMVYAVWDTKGSKLEPQAQALLGQPRIPPLTPERNDRWRLPKLPTR